MMKNLIFVITLIVSISIYAQNESENTNVLIPVADSQGKKDNNEKILSISDKQENQHKIKNTAMKTKNSVNPIQKTQAENNAYSVIIDIFRKGKYKKYSYRLVNTNFEALMFTLNNDPKVIICKNLSPSEALEFEEFLYSFPLDTLEDEYINKDVRGEYHLEYHIKIGEKHKSIYVYFQQQKDLVALYKRLSQFIPVDAKFLYYRP